MDNKEKNKKTDKYVVQKSNPLLSLAKSEITLSAFKIMDAYLGKINSHKPETRYVVFQKGELERLLGEKRLRRDALDIRLKSLFAPVTIEDPAKPDGHVIISLFEKATAHKDEFGSWTVELACSLPAIEYVFNVEEKGYLPYFLKNIIDLTSRYSYIMYLYLEKNRYRGTWSIGIEELKDMLGCVSERYKTFKFFNSEVLKKCFDEISSKTTLSYTYEPTGKVGRRYTKIKFCVTSSNAEFTNTISLPQLDDAMSAASEVLDADELRDARYGGDEDLAFLAEAVNDEFCKEDMEQIRMILTRIDIPKDHNVSEWDATLCGRHHYLMEKYAALNAEDARKKMNGEKIDNRLKYFLAMLEKDAYEPSAYKDNNF